MQRVFVVCLALTLALAGSTRVDAQSLGTFRWQLQPYCNVVTLAVTQNGGVYRLEGTDDQCGAGSAAASAIGTAFLNPNGTVGMGLNVVAAPGGAPTPLSAQIAIASLGGTWRDAAGNTGAFIFTPGAGTGGSTRPVPAAVIPLAIQLRQDGGLLAGGTQGVGTIPTAGLGTRMMWYPAAAAFRAGQVVGTEWDAANIGLASVALGRNTIASGFAGTALGQGTTASGDASTAMGKGALASGAASTAMGIFTTASGPASTTMGDRATASGFASTAIGAGEAHGDYSLASIYGIARGDRSAALGLSEVLVGAGGSFAWGDTSIGARVIASEPNTFLVRAAGGVRFASNAAQTSGVVMFSGASAWSPLSDRHMKEHIRELDGEDVLRKLAGMPVTEWSYTTQNAAIRHVGPMAQDFHAAFGLGEDALRISTIDADGIALAGVKALEARTRETNERLTRENDELRARLARLESLLERR